MKKKFVIVIIVLIILILILKNIPLGYEKVNKFYSTENGNQVVELGIPKLSFMEKENEKSYSYKNIRGNLILTKEVDSYLNTLDKIKCNNTIYYYDKKNDFTIISYSVKNHILYNTISYTVRYGNYCFTKKTEDYAAKIGGIKRVHGMGNGFSLSEDKEFTPMLTVRFVDDFDEKNQKFTATMLVEYLTPIPNEWRYVYRNTIEDSSGTYEIKGDKLYYTRDDIKVKSDDVEIPKVSVFEIDDGKLVLIDNYLSNYENDIILK